MNNIIDIKRLTRFIICENKSNGYINTIIMGGFALLLTVFTYRSLFFVAGINETFWLLPIFGTRNETILIILILSPFLVYSGMLKKEKRVMNTILPVSDTERYLSMLINTFVIAPVIIAITATCIDILASGFSLKYIKYLFETTGIFNYIMLMWGGISISTFFLLVLCRYKTWIGIMVIIATIIIELFFIGAVLNFAIDEYVGPTYLVQVYKYVSIVNIFVFQILVYYNIRKIKA